MEKSQAPWQQQPDTDQLLQTAPVLEYDLWTSQRPLNHFKGKEVPRATKPPSLAGSSVSVHLQFLRRCGFCRLARPPRATCSPARTPSVIIRVHDAYRALVLTITFTYLVQECIYAYKARSDMDKLARVMFLLLCHITSIAKQIVFYIEAERVDRMIAAFEDPLYNEGNERARALLRETAASAGLFARTYSGTAVVTCTLWIIFPIMYHLRGQPVEFPFYVYIDYSHSVKFTLVLLYSYYVTTLVGIANTTMDAFMATVLKQCKTQLQILRMNFKSLQERALSAARSVADESYEKALNRLFMDCVNHYKKIAKSTRTLQDIFGIAILIQFGIGGWILCMAAYKIVSLSVLSIEFASMTLFICCILTELFLYCYYGNEVQVESERVVESIYSMEWTRTPARFRRSLVVLMECARRPLRPAAGRVIPLSLETFLKIIKSSYTFYAVLRQTKQP